jgi:hypothetical protein
VRQVRSEKGFRLAQGRVVLVFVQCTLGPITQLTAGCGGRAVMTRFITLHVSLTEHACVLLHGDQFRSFLSLDLLRRGLWRVSVCAPLFSRCVTLVECEGFLVRGPCVGGQVR